MNPADLQHGEELRVTQPAQKMHALPIAVRDLCAHFVDEDLLPGFSFRRFGAITHAVAADDQHLRLRAQPQHPGQGTHKDVVSTVGLEVAADKSQHFVVPRPTASIL